MQSNDNENQTGAPPVIVWLRRDLRVADNPALGAAAKISAASGAPVLVIYVHDPKPARALGAASQWWLHHSLTALEKDLAQIGGQLKIVTGRPYVTLLSIAQQCKASHVFWNRRYDGAGCEIDAAVKAALKDDGVHAESFKGSLLFEPWEIKTGSGLYYKVFTPFWRNCLKQASSSAPVPTPLPAPKSVRPYVGDIGAVDIGELKLLPTAPNWARGFTQYFTPGSSPAHAALDRFLAGRVNEYTDARNRPDISGTSRLSAHLAFGEISPRQIWHAAQNSGQDAAKFLSEIGWREFSYNLLFHNPNLARENFKPAFDGFTWDNEPSYLRAWQSGQTGYPFVDAGMRELWATGWQHNRVRMVTASFLIKHLRCDWREGERWFWDTLVDADPASNAASWQWVAGSGADAAPYFRVFNPFSQGQKFDPKGDYVRKWVPELANLPAKYIHTPWEAPEIVLKDADITLGQDYPRPIVDHKAAREKALAAYQATKTENS